MVSSKEPHLARELSWFYLAIIDIQLEKNKLVQGGLGLKEPEGCRVDAPQQLN